MAYEVPPLQRKPGAGVDYWLGAILGLLLIVLEAVYVNGAYLFLIPLMDPPPYLGGAVLTRLFLEDLLGYFFTFFLLGLLRGRATGRVAAARHISVTACLISASALVGLPWVLFAFIGGETSLNLLEFALGKAWFIGLAQLLVGVGGGVLGGLIGCRFLRRRPDQPERHPSEGHQLP